MKWSHQVRTFLQKSLPLSQRLPDHCYLAMLQVSQTTMDDPGRAAGGTRGKIVLVDQQRPAARTSALTRDGHPIDASATLPALGMGRQA